MNVNATSVAPPVYSPFMADAVPKESKVAVLARKVADFVQKVWQLVVRWALWLISELREIVNLSRIMTDLRTVIPRPCFYEANRDNHVATLQDRMLRIPHSPGEAQMSVNDLKIARAQYRLEHLKEIAGIPMFREGLEELDDEKMYNAALAEVLSKKVAYRNIPNDFTFNIAHYNGRIERYSVTRIAMHDAPGGLYGTQYAYGLMPRNCQLEPILLFAGTVTDLNSGRPFGETLLADLCPYGPGHELFIHGKYNLRRWVQSAQARGGQKVHAIGHSLGGALATYAGIAFPDQIGKVTTFGTPGLHPHHEAEWNGLGERQPELTHWIDTEDFIPLMGPHIFGRCYATRRIDNRTPFFGMHEAHSKLNLLGGHTRIFRLDTSTETSSGVRRKAVGIANLIVSNFYYGMYRMLTHGR